MKIIEKKLVIPHGPNRTVVSGFIAYISQDKPILVWNRGWEVGNDVHDDYVEQLSFDNGRTWGEPRMVFKNQRVEGGHIVHTEYAGLYVPERNLLLRFTNQKLESRLEMVDLSTLHSLHITVGPPPDKDGTVPVRKPFISDFSFKQGICVSFCHPIQDSKGRILVPVNWQKMEDAESVICGKNLPRRTDMPNVFADVYECALLVGEFRAGDEIEWRLGKAVPVAFEKTSRGLCEGTVAELSDGRLAMILRGSNAAWPDKPGYKWLSYSDDGGGTWSKAAPLACDDGGFLKSSATGSALFRSIRNGKLYWIGNLCLDGQRANGNFPRTPLYIAEMQENPLALKRETIRGIECAAPHESPRLQLSNFRFYQDRATGDVVLYLSRLSERGEDNGRWVLADHYQYRISID